MIELARERQRRDLERLPTLGYTWEPERAERVRTFFRDYLKHYKGEWSGQPFELLDWEWNDVVLPVFGWYRPDGTRRFRRCYVEVPRKNGKSTFGAGLGLYHMIADGEPGAEVYSAATKRDQAKIVWSDAKHMVEASRELKRFVTTFRANMHVEETASKFEPLSSDSKTLDGLNPHCVIVDELHAHEDRHLLDVLLTAMGARTNWIAWMITTAGLYGPEAVGWQEHEYARMVLQGEHEDESYFSYIACADKDDPWDDPATWAKANPSYGVTVKSDYLKEQASKALAQPSFTNTFLRYHLDLWVQQIERWILPEKWRACGGEFNETELEGEVCFAGLDLASTSDITALALFFPGSGKVVWRFWVPEDTVAERSRRDKVPYDEWSRRGHIDTTPGDVVDQAYIEQEIVALSKRFRIQELWFDPWNADRLATTLADSYGVNTIKCGQGIASMNEPAKAFERLVTSGALKHGDNPVATWMAGNVAKREDSNGNIRPDRKASREKIDGIVAAVMAVGAATKGRDHTSVYETRGPIEVTW